MKDERQITKMKELPSEERPREKIISCGPGVLSNSELIALLIGSGRRDSSAVMIAEKILAGGSGAGLRYLTECTAEELCRVNGIGPAKAAVILAAVELGRRISTLPPEKRAKVSSPEAVSALFMDKMRYLKKECFQVLLLNVKNEIIMIDDVSVGGLSSADAHPREIFANSVKKGAANIVLVHNHPSGDPEPSREDVRLTARLVEAGRIMGIQVLDHIVIGDGRYVSMKEMGLIS